MQDYIVAGDCYQINLTQEFVGHAQWRLLASAEKFWQLTQAPYAGYLRSGDFELLSCSPELFIEFNANRNIVTKPIKGTMPRFSDPEQDQASKQQLIDSEKDRAENVMIVDLLRNDLSVYAEVAASKTPKLFISKALSRSIIWVSESCYLKKLMSNPLMYCSLLCRVAQLQAHLKFAPCKLLMN